jgi:hypothetical protein
VEIGLFDVLVGVKEEGITADELAKKTDSDEILISEPLLILIGDSLM